MAEAHGNRTHPRGSSPRAPDLKSGRATSALSASNYSFYIYFKSMSRLAYGEKSKYGDYNPRRI